MSSTSAIEGQRWRQRKRAALRQRRWHGARPVGSERGTVLPADPGTVFRNPFQLADLATLDDAALARVLGAAGETISIHDLALSLRRASRALVDRVAAALPSSKRRCFRRALNAQPRQAGTAGARRRVLDALFWGLTYARTPRLYDELVAGEALHPGIFRRLAPWLRGATVLDAGAGSGRATFCSLAAGAALVLAADPEPGLLALLREKATGGNAARIAPLQAVAGALPLRSGAVDATVCASAFFVDGSADERLAELQRVTRPGGLVALIWPRPADFSWLAAHGFRYTALPLRRKMRVRFQSLRAGLRLARRFYGKRPAVLSYLHRRRGHSVPYAVLGVNPPHDFCWLVVGAGARSEAASPLRRAWRPFRPPTSQSQSGNMATKQATPSAFGPNGGATQPSRRRRRRKAPVR